MPDHRSDAITTAENDLFEQIAKGMAHRIRNGDDRFGFDGRTLKMPGWTFTGLPSQLVQCLNSYGISG